MSTPPAIVDLQKVIEPHLNGRKLLSYQSRYLTKPGENYGSVILALDAMVQQSWEPPEMIQLVAKLPPITNDLYWQVFQPERTCLTENATYKHLGPLLHDIQREAGVAEEKIFNPFPIYYGSRISLDDAATVVDRDAVLVLENLQISGFRPGDRFKMYDFKHTKLILEDIAKFHALAIAARQKKPEVFDQYVRPYFQRFNVNEGISETEKNDMMQDVMKEIEIATDNNKRVIERILMLMAMGENEKRLPTPADDLFTSIVHCDLWINNIMIQYDENGSPNKLKFVDFQIAEIESVVNDIIFFLFSSVEANVLDQHYDEFLRIYYDAFVNSLQSIGVPTTQYSYEAFLEEVKRVGPLQVGHALFMARIILADKSNMPEDYKDMDMNVIRKSIGQTEIKEKIAHIIQTSKKLNFL